MLREQLEHVIEEANAGEDLVLACAFEHEMAGDLRLFRVAIDACFSHRTVSNSFTLSSTATAPFCFEAVRQAPRAGDCRDARCRRIARPAACALRASSTVSPTYVIGRFGCVADDVKQSVGRGLRLRDIVVGDDHGPSDRAGRSGRA